MPFVAAEFHHGYLGVALFGLGFALGLWWLMVPGAFLALDDAASHWLGWRTPLVRLNDWLWPRWALYREVQAFLDFLFGKR